MGEHPPYRRELGKANPATNPQVSQKVLQRAAVRGLAPPLLNFFLGLKEERGTGGEHTVNPKGLR